VIVHQTKIKLHETDAAGVLFFSNQLKIAHDAYEVFLTHIGYPIQIFLSDLDYFLPIVHTEADYFEQLQVGDEISISVHVEQLGKSSFTLGYNFKALNGKNVGEAKTVHVCVDKKSHKKIDIPADLRTSLQKHSIR
jgi:1,4-dihydroxy-2-naphthoyl-CoA hydrolase